MRKEDSESKRDGKNKMMMKTATSHIFICFFRMDCFSYYSKLLMMYMENIALHANETAITSEQAIA